MVEDKHISQTLIAETMGIDKSQLWNWMNGKQPVPKLHLTRLAELLAGATGGILVSSKQSAHDMAENLVQHAARLFDKEGGTFGKMIALEMCREAERLAYDVDGSDDGMADRVQKLHQFLAAAANVLFWAYRAYSDEVCIITPENISLHVRFPHNYFVGVIIDAGFSDDKRRLPWSADDKERAREVSAIVKKQINIMANPLKYSSRAKPSLCTEHAVHISLRHDPSNSNHVLKSFLDSKDMGTRRMAYCGLGATGSETTERFIHELKTDPHFRNLAWNFDAVHYGDTLLVDGSVPHNVALYSNVVQNTIRHAQTGHRRWRQFALYKMTSILEEYGARNFDLSLRDGSIGQIVRGIGNLNPHERLPEESHFLTTFEKLVPTRRIS